MFSYFHWFYYQGVHSQVCTLVNMNLSSIVASLIRIQKVCYNLNSRCQANTFFDDDIFWEISIKCDIFTNKCLLGGYGRHPPPHLQNIGLQPFDFIGRCDKWRNINFLILTIFIGNYMEIYFSTTQGAIK